MERTDCEKYDDIETCPQVKQVTDWLKLNLTEIMEMSKQFRAESEATTEEARAMRRVAESQNKILQGMSERLTVVESDIKYLKRENALANTVAHTVSRIEGTLKIIMIAFGALTTFTLFIAGLLIEHLARVL